MELVKKGYNPTYVRGEFSKLADALDWEIGMNASEITVDNIYAIALISANNDDEMALRISKIIRAIGVKLCTITPSRGFSIELSSATIIIIGSRLGIPLSTTHCQVGATMGVAALEDAKKCSGMNCEVVLKTIFGWIATLVIVGGTTALLVGFTTYSPSVYDFYPTASDAVSNLTNLTNITV